jgi:hypothetical protein
MSPTQVPVIARQIPEGVIPLVAVEGSAYECGSQYADIVLSRYPGFRLYLDEAWSWRELGTGEKKLVEKHAPHLIDLFRGITDVAGPPPAPKPSPGRSGGCSSFSLSPAVTLDGAPISGQTKDTPLDRVGRYIVLRMRITAAPTILVLAYPGEVMGYGFWSTGMSLFRNTLYAAGPCASGLNYGVVTIVMLSCRSVDEAAELVQAHGRNGTGNTLMADAAGKSISVETNAGGQAYIRDVDGINVHTNHALRENTLAFAEYAPGDSESDSVFRHEQLCRRFERERGRLAPAKVLALLAEHAGYPRGTCKHRSDNGDITTAAVIAEPTRGLLHVVRGQPCCNWPVTYSV